ncbi:MAG: DUF1634 domain-containing protein [Proteobacteria bacterium]|nr:MAG: DUF1634 domain-containing protein [Pseudomonadota bacterium]
MRDTRLEALELFIAKFLRYGVLFAGLVIFIGWMSQINFHRNVFEDFHVYQNMSLFDTLWFLFLQHNWGLLTAYLGLMLLIALPFLRVVLTAGVFVIEKDYLLAGCAVLVMAGLILSFALGFEI